MEVFMKNIITIQHTQSIQHTNKMIGSWRDWDLTEHGIEQAQRIGTHLMEDIKEEQYVMYSSDLLRTKHTANIVAGILGIKPIFTDALREFNLGEAIGQSKEWARHNSICPVWPGTIDWPETIDDKPFTDAETKRDVWNRLLVFQNQFMDKENENVIIVSHDGTLSIFFALWLGIDIDMLNTCNLSGKTGGVSFLREDSNKHRIISRLNDLSYIR